jgi:NAD-dependent dihydropyrimidine dehydrogenase PreA subunit
MRLQINQELCTGCGVCVDACAPGAIQVVDQRAVIEADLCTQCEACAEACPNEAITVIPMPAQSMTSMVLPASNSRPVPVQPEITAPERRIAPLAGTALAFFGQEIAPRLVDIFIAALERRLAQPRTDLITPSTRSVWNQTAQGRGQRKQIRYRGGRLGTRNHEERS